MTNSTDNTDIPKSARKKDPKKKGPIRFEAVIPVALIFGLAYAYFHFLFDSHLKAGIEWAGTHVNGAEVNVGGVRTSFLGGSFALMGLQVTDKNTPQRNLVQIERMHFKFLWDALLRAKFVVEDASITNIQALVPRKKPGYVVPPSPKKDGPGFLQKVEEGVIDHAKTKFNNNVLGDIATLLEGTDPQDQLKNIQEQLKTDARVKELEKELKEKEALWRERLKNLPQAKDFEALSDRAKKLNFKSKNPVEIAAAVKEGEKILKEADEKIKYFEKTSKDLKTEVGTFDDTLKDLERMAREDLKDLQNRFKIPELDAASISKDLFMGMFLSRLGSLRKYMEVARQYMPPKKPEGEKEPEIVPPKRGEGKTYHFPITTGYPLFWLKHASISSEPNASSFSGRIKGSLKDLTTNPVQLGRPFIAEINGDFPKQEIQGLLAKLTVDHTTAEPWERVDIKVGSYGVDERRLSDSKDVKLAIVKAQGEISLNALLKNQTLDVNIDNNFKNINYDIDAKSRTVKEILTAVITGIPVINVKAAIRGSWTDFDASIRSNLGDDLLKGFKAQIDAKVEEAKKKLKAFIDDRIKAEKDKLTAEFKKAQSQITGQLDEKKKELDKARSQAESTVKGGKGESGPGKQLESQGKKAVKDLKKKFGF